MPLLDLLSAAPDAIAKMALHAIIASAGDGKLNDKSECQTEFRQYLTECDLPRLKGFIEECLQPGAKQGLALQDIVNELGRRLGFEVENGRYQGVSGSNGMDGFWKLPEGRAIVVEVKTTDAYRINLETIVAYRDQAADRDKCSILIVVGREDTGDLEAQVRGSRHAWDIRIISVESLQRLCEVRLKTETETQKRIEQLLTPFEYTRLDRIIDITFAAVSEMEGSEVPPIAPVIEPGPAQETTGYSQIRTPREIIEIARTRLLEALAAKDGIHLSKRSQATFQNATGDYRVVCSVSKVYPDGGMWYAYHPSWDTFLVDAENGLLCLAIVDANFGFVIPRSVIAEQLGNLNSSGDPSQPEYWHLVVRELAGSWSLVRRGLDVLSLEPYKVLLT